MRYSFREQFRLPVEEVYGFFRSPADWVRLYGFGGEVRDLGQGWFAVPLASFPFPLVAKMTRVLPGERASWVYRGFWRGEGDVRFRRAGGVTIVEGYERLSIRWLFFLSPLVERGMRAPFHALWQRGWRRLRRMEPAGEPSTPAGSA